MRIIQLDDTACLSVAEAETLKSKYLRLDGSAGLDGENLSTTWAGVDRTVRGEATTLVKPDGTILAIYIPDALPRRLLGAAYDTFKQVDPQSNNRGYAAGEISGDDDVGIGHAEVGELAGTRYTPIKRDGTLSNTTYAKSVPSGIIGYDGRYPRINFCRQTAFTQAHFDIYARAVPFIQKVSDLFREYAPDRWAAQQAAADKVHTDFRIPGTVFSTITINHSWRTAVHKDAGDYAEGFGVMAALEGGQYKGAELIFPRFRAAIDMRTGGLCLADVHEWHGNAPLVKDPGQGLRVSAVFYLKTKMLECGSMAEERARADAWSTQLQERSLAVPEVVPADPPPLPLPAAPDAGHLHPPAVQTFLTPLRLVTKPPPAAAAPAPPADAAPEVPPPPAPVPEPPAFTVPGVLKAGEVLLPGFTVTAPTPDAVPEAAVPPVAPLPPQSTGPQYPDLWARAQAWAETWYQALVEQREKAPW